MKKKIKSIREWQKELYSMQVNDFENMLDAAHNILIGIKGVKIKGEKNEKRL